MSGGVHLTFELRSKPKSRKTEIWTVVGQGEYQLGEIRWWPQWRRYTFHPVEDTLYDALCLTVLAEFCEKQTRARKAARAQEKVGEEPLPPCMSYCKVGHLHEGECVSMDGR